MRPIRPSHRGQLAAGVLASALVLVATTIQGEEGPSRKRAAPPPAPSVVVSGVRYQAVDPNERDDLDPDGGYVAAVDGGTGRELWIARIYHSSVPPEMEADKREVFIARLKLMDKGRALMIIDERGRRFRLDLQSHAAAPIH